MQTIVFFSAVFNTNLDKAEDKISDYTYVNAQAIDMLHFYQMQKLGRMEGVVDTLQDIC